MWGAITFTRRSFRHFQNVISKMLPHWIHTFLHCSFFNFFSFHFSRLAASTNKLCTKYLHNTWKQDIITCTFVMHTISAAPKRAPTALIFGDFFAIFHAALIRKRIVPFVGRSYSEHRKFTRRVFFLLNENVGKLIRVFSESAMLFVAYTFFIFYLFVLYFVPTFKSTVSSFQNSFKTLFFQIS